MRITKSAFKPETDLLIPVFQGQSPEGMQSMFSELPFQLSDVFKSDFKGETGELHIHYEAGRRFFFLGMGNKTGFGPVYKTTRQFSAKHGKKLKKSLGLYLAHLIERPETLAEAVINGLLTGTYQIGAWKTDDQPEHPLSHHEAEIQVYHPSIGDEYFVALANRALIVAESQIRILDLMNTPSNIKTPTYMAEWAEESGGNHGFKVTVLSDDAIWENNLMALAAVNRGSEEPARFIIMEYVPEVTENCPSVGLVGKAITYDTGGLSIKPSDSMSYMKSDMGGAAAILGAFEAAVRLEMPLRLTAVIPVTDNLVDSMSIKPGDIINSYSGKTIEVLNTDAEGRLILADGLAYMVKNHQVDYLLDLATLTGATVRTLGSQAGGLFSNDDALAAMLEESGQESGERLWRFPLWDEYGDDLKSDTADVKNISRSPVAGHIFAAKFLEVFIDKHPRWAHLDVAGVCFGDTEFGKEKSGTAYGIRLLIGFFEKITSA